MSAFWVLQKKKTKKNKNKARYVKKWANRTKKIQKVQNKYKAKKKRLKIMTDLTFSIAAAVANSFVQISKLYLGLVILFFCYLCVCVCALCARVCVCVIICVKK